MRDKSIALLTGRRLGSVGAGQLGGTSVALSVAAAAMLAVAGLPSSVAFAQGCQGQAANGDSGSEGAALTQRIQEGVIEKAKSSAGLSGVVMFGGVSASGSHLKHDGYKLKTPVGQNCPAGAPALTQLSGFETNAFSVSALGELDLSRSFGLAPGTLFKVGAAVGGKSLETKTGDIIANNVNTGSSKVEEDGVQVDLYALLAFGPTYGILAGSIGRGDSRLTNTSFSGNAGSPTGRADTNYSDYAISLTVGHVLTLNSTSSTRTLLDVSGGLLYSSYTRDGFVDTIGSTFSDTNTDEFAGKLEAKLAYQMLQGSDVFTPYLKAGVKHRFDYDSTFTATVPAAAFSDRFSLKADETFLRAGGGISASFNGGAITGGLDLTYQGSGDSNEVIGKGQLIFKLN